MKQAIRYMILLLLPQTALATPVEVMITEFREDEGALMRTYVIRESDEYYARLTDFYANWKSTLAGVRSEQTTNQEMVDWLLLDNLIDQRAFFLNAEHDLYLKVKPVADFASPLYEFVKNRRRGQSIDAKQLARAMDQAEVSIAEKTRALENSKFTDRLEALKAADIVRSLQEGLEDAHEFYNGYDPMYSWWMKTSYPELDKALEEYARFLEDNIDEANFVDDGSGIRGKPIGEEAIKKSLAYEFIPYDPQELIDAAQKQLEWCESEMIRASRELGYGDDWLAALEHVKNTYVPAGTQPAAIDTLAEEAIVFIEGNDMITVPPLAKETWRMRMMSPQRQLINPFFTGGEVISISYPTEEMSYSDKMMSMRGNNPNFSWPTVQHELIPGHHLQQFMTSRYKVYRRPFSTPFWGEGWALYWEILLWDREFYHTPEQRMGMLFWRMHRCARIIFSLSFHLEKMTPQECIDLLVERVGHEPANAIAEVRRSFEGRYGPLYQIAYMVGGLQFYALRNELLASGMSEKEYHDRVMHEGRIPVAALRAIIKDEKIKTKRDLYWSFSTDFRL